MEKQPLDDLFARKLREAGVRVSPGGLNRVQSRLSVKPLIGRRPVVWYYAAVACLFCVITLGYVSYNDLPEKGSAVVAKRTKSTQTGGPISSGNTDGLVRVKKRNTGAETSEQTYAGEVKRSVVLPVQQQLLTLGSPVIRAERLVEQIVNAPSSLLKGLSEPPSLALSKAESFTPTGQTETELKPLAERVIVMTIHVEETETTVIDNEKVRPEPPVRTGGLGNLLTKIKQLKDGEILAKAIHPPTPTDQRSRFGRTFSDLRETFKNEMIIDR